jgi:hypothetical protein
MRLLKAVLAGLFVLMAGLFAAAVFALSAVVLFVGRRLKGRGIGSVTSGPVKMRRRVGKNSDAIDIQATEVPTRSAR